MRNIRTSIFISLLGVFLLCGCKEKKTTGFEYLEHLVEEINTQSDKTFANGTILEKCEYNINKVTASLYFMLKFQTIVLTMLMEIL